MDAARRLAADLWEWLALLPPEHAFLLTLPVLVVATGMLDDLSRRR